MLFTRTLRRKLMFGVGLVLVMLLTLSISGIYGLTSYRDLVHDLNHTLNVAPRKADLVEALAGLCAPLPHPTHPETPALTVWPEQFTFAVTRARHALDEFSRRRDAVPFGAGPYIQRPVTDPLMQFLVYNMEQLELELPGLSDSDPERRAAALDAVQKRANAMIDTAASLPDPAEGLSVTLAQARRVYRSSLVTVWTASGVVLLLFAGLLRSGYTWIFYPMRQLHQGALRVAHGDFDYRMRLKTRDEMAELAAAFNEMTARFQEIRADLDRQVVERSRQLVRSERLAGVGFLAAGVAHEINNPLSAIAMAAESLEGRLSDLLGRLDPAESAVVQQYLRMIQTESFRCREITERLLDFSRGRDAVREPTDLARLVGEVVAMVQHLSKYRDRKIVFHRLQPCLASVNGAELKQVVLNLVANGLEAMRPGGTLTIAITQQTDQVALEFRDEGCGMTPEVMENMFEPFFTSKQNGQGTGLGLSISHRIVAQHGGTLSASSPGPGQGSTFTVRLPREAAQARAA